MSTVTIKKQRTGTDVSMSLTLTDGGSRVSWKSLSDVYVYMYADEQRVMAGLVDHRISPDDEFTLLATYGVNEPQYLGVNRVVISCNYAGRTRTYDAPVVDFVQNMADEGTTDVDVISVALQVSEVSTSLLDEAIAACIEATAASVAELESFRSESADWATAEAARRQEEGQRKVNENKRVQAEKKREQAEEQRASSESSRVNAEEERTAAEEDRQNEEDFRRQAETDRMENEDLRQSGESSRRSAESGRSSAETSRAQAEQLRVMAENVRLQDENARRSAETTRGTNEQARQTAEGLRASAEQARQNAEGTRQQTFVANEQQRQEIFDSKESQRDAAMQTISQEAQKLSELEGIVRENYEAKETPMTASLVKEGVYPRIDTKTYSALANLKTSVFDVSELRYIRLNWKEVNTTYYGIVLTNDADNLSGAKWIPYPSSTGEMQIATEGYSFIAIAAIYGASTIIGEVRECVLMGSVTRDTVAVLSAEIVQLESNKLDKKTGKNLIDLSACTLGYYFNSPSGFAAPDSTYYITGFIPVEPSTAYHISTADDNAVGFASAYMIAYDANRNVIGGVAISNKNYTTPNNARYMRISIYYTRLQYAQMEKGNTRTDYEPYSSVGGYADALYPRPFFGKKFYSFGDSIVAQEQWQSKLAKMRGLDYVASATKSTTHPLGIGGATICPRIQLQTTPNAFPAKDSQGNPVKDFDGNNLYFLEGKGVGQSLYMRADWFANIYHDAEVIVINGGQNDEKTWSYADVGNAADLPYEGKEYVVAKYANIAKAYGGAGHSIAILDDGSATLPAEFRTGGYTILTTAPTFASCVSGLVKKLCTNVPTAMIVGNSLLPSNNALKDENAWRTPRAAMLVAAYKQNRIPVADMYSSVGVNEFNWSNYFNDNYHPNSNGGLRMATILSHIL